MTKFNENKYLKDFQSRAESRTNQEYHHASMNKKLQPCLTITILPSTSYIPEDSKSSFLSPRANISKSANEESEQFRRDLHHKNMNDFRSILGLPPEDFYRN